MGGQLSSSMSGKGLFAVCTSLPTAQKAINTLPPSFIFEKECCKQQKKARLAFVMTVVNSSPEATKPAMFIIVSY